MTCTWESYVRGQEQVALGQAMIDTLASLYGCRSDEDSIKRAVYKTTECGAWISFFPGQQLGVEVGSIVEGVDGDGVPGIFVKYDLDEDEAAFVSRYREAVQDVEDAVDEIWMATHGCSDCYGDPPGGPVNPDCESCEGHGTVI